MLTPAAHVRPSRLVLAQDYPTHSKSELKPRSHVEMTGGPSSAWIKEGPVARKNQATGDRCSNNEWLSSPYFNLQRPLRSKARFFLSIRRPGGPPAPPAEMLVGMFNHHDR